MATLPMVVVEVEEKAPVECPIALNRITNVHLDLHWLWCSLDTPLPLNRDGKGRVQTSCGGTGLAG